METSKATGIVGVELVKARKEAVMDWDAWGTVLYLFVAPLVVLYIGGRLTISVHDDKWDIMLLQESMDAIIFVTDQTGMIRRGMMFPIRSLGYPAPPPSA